MHSMRINSKIGAQKMWIGRLSNPYGEANSTGDLRPLISDLCPPPSDLLLFHRPSPKRSDRPSSFVSSASSEALLTPPSAKGPHLKPIAAESAALQPQTSIQTAKPFILLKPLRPASPPGRHSGEGFWL